MADDTNNTTTAAMKRKKKQGGFRTVPFILANEVCDKFATTGFNANMITYLTQQLHLPLVDASNTLTVFSGTSSLTPILGALAADSFAGRFWTIIAGSLFFVVGMSTLTLSAVLPGLRPPPCSAAHAGRATHSGAAAASASDCRRASPGQLMFLYLSLVCTALGSGGIRPCVVAFAADQFRGAVKATASFFNLYFFCMALAVVLALTGVVYMQENVGWGWGLGVPAIAMAVSVIAFSIGYPLYVKLKPSGSPFVRLAQVAVAAIRKRKLPKPHDPAALYDDEKIDAVISTNGRMLHTNQLRCLDRAAVVTDGDKDGGGRPKLWRLATVHRVEELKSIIRLIPIWSTGILLTVSSSPIHTFTVLQARSMDRHLSPTFSIPPATMSIFTSITTVISLIIYDRAFVPFARRFTGRPSGITYLQRMGIGLAIGVLANVAAALAERQRKIVAADHGLLDEPSLTVPISVFWLVPQYAIHGLGDAFMLVGHMEFLYDQAPESMRSTAVALFWLASSAGNYLGTVLVSLVHAITDKNGGDWLQDNINRGKLDYYYWLITGLQVLNLGYYILCAKFFTPKKLEARRVESNEEDDAAGDCVVELVEVPPGAGAEKPHGGAGVSGNGAHLA